MIEHELNKLVKHRGLCASDLDDATYESLMEEVLMVWAKPDKNPLCPPPHSTGAAVDLTIVDGSGKQIDMGSEIDAIGNVSLPNYFLDSADPNEQIYHRNRELLCVVMTKAGFRRLPHEWWHFSFGDQVWAMLEWLDAPEKPINAIYGAAQT